MTRSTAHPHSPTHPQSWSNPAPGGWILYDNSCGLCRRWVSVWEGTLRRRGFAIAPLQAEWVQERLGLDPEKSPDELRLLFADGRQLAGAAAYRHVLQRIWWAWPLYLVSVTPGLRQVFDRACRSIAAKRQRISAACHMRAK